VSNKIVVVDFFQNPTVRDENVFQSDIIVVVAVEVAGDLFEDFDVTQGVVFQCHCCYSSSQCQCCCCCCSI